MLSSVSPADFCKRDFDYIIVGGGTAGLALATRLSRDPEIGVGVLEAGPADFNEKEIDVPGRFGETIGSKYDWQFETSKQPGLNGRSLPWPRGKVLGGTSALNFMTWNRANKEDYDAWEELGNAGWGWDSLLPFFKKTETFHAPSLAHLKDHKSHFDPEFHGKDGPIQTVHSLEYSTPHKYWHETMNSLGMATNESHLSGSNVGVWTSITNVHPKTRTRSYATTAYFLPNASRSNLAVLTGATVHKVLLEKQDGNYVASGVSFNHEGVDLIAYASKEIIICAGSVQSPQLLELSGIGNPEILKKADVSIKVDSPHVGENLQEHMMTATIYEIPDDIETPDDLRADPGLAKKADLMYMESQSGPRAMLPCSLSYVPLAHFVPIEELQTHISTLTAKDSNVLKRDEIIRRKFQSTHLGNAEYIFDVGNWSPFFKSEPGKKYATMLLIYQYPFSKGSIHIRSSDTDDKPVINPQYFEGLGGEVDFEMMLRAQAFGQKVVETKPLSSMITKRVFPSEGQDCDVEMRAWLRNTCITDWHPVGTCAMGGSLGIEGGVVDERLRVYGVKSLRVCDASIIPLQIAAHPQATVYAIAEKAAAMILEDRESGKQQ